MDLETIVTILLRDRGLLGIERWTIIQDEETFMDKEIKRVTSFVENREIVRNSK